MDVNDAIADLAHAGGNLIKTITNVIGAYAMPIAQAKGEVKGGDQVESGKEKI